MTLYLDSSEVKDAKESPLWFHKRNLMQTATGYGIKLATTTMVKTIDGHWHRIYVMTYSNCGTAYILRKGKRHVVGGHTEDKIKNFLENK